MLNCTIKSLTHQATMLHRSQPCCTVRFGEWHLQLERMDENLARCVFVEGEGGPRRDIPDGFRLVNAHTNACVAQIKQEYIVKHNTSYALMHGRRAVVLFDDERRDTIRVVA